MADSRPIPSFTAGEFDIPPATITLGENSMTRLDRLGRALERQREESDRQREDLERSRGTLRHGGWVALPGIRRHRWLRASETHSPTYEGWASSRHERSPDSDDEQPREAKRRKIDVTSPVLGSVFKYGYYGQVEPGRLKLELCSCDGGVHHHRDTGHYGPTNILKHDQSVYSSKSPTCNIILQHHDGTSFALEKLTIMAPDSGFTAPVKRGAICVAMGYADLMPLTAEALLNDDRHTISDPEQDDDGEDDDEDDDGDEERLGLLASLNDPRLLAAASASSYEDGWPPLTDWLTQRPLPSAISNSNRDGRVWDVPANWAPLEPSTRMRINRQSRAPPPETSEEFTLDSGLRVTIGQEHDLGAPEPQSGEETRRSVRMARLAALEAFPDPSPRPPRPSAGSTRERPAALGAAQSTRSSANQMRSRGVQTGELSKASAAGVTQIPFEIPDGASSVTIKFDPPVSGTCLLLRMHAKAKDKNVDIRSVIATGYAGPRFFPAVKMR